MQTAEPAAPIEYNADAKLQQNAQVQHSVYQNSAFPGTIPIVAQAGVIDDMEE